MLHNAVAAVKCNMKLIYILAAIFIAFSLIQKFHLTVNNCHLIEKLEKYGCNFQKVYSSDHVNEVKITCSAKHSTHVECTQIYLLDYLQSSDSGETSFVSLEA